MILRGENKPLENLEERMLDLELATREAAVKRLVGKQREMAPTFTPHVAHGVAPKREVLTSRPAPKEALAAELHRVPAKSAEGREGA